MNTINDFEIIDFHTHPFIREEQNICAHRSFCNMSVQGTAKLMRDLGVSHICGSVIGGRNEGEDLWQHTMAVNNEALILREIYGDFYIPGFHVHPAYVRESCEEIERMNGLGVKLIGELVPYFMAWEDMGYDYQSGELYEILDLAQQYDMVVSFHSMHEDAMDRMVADHPHLRFVAAHPGEYGAFCRHMERMKRSENYWLDLSGYGIFRHGMLRHAIDEHGAERFIFGSDYPTCNPGMYIGGVLLDTTITDREKEMIFSKNAKALLVI